MENIGDKLEEVLVESGIMIGYNTTNDQVNGVAAEKIEVVVWMVLCRIPPVLDFSELF